MSLNRILLAIKHCIKSGKQEASKEFATAFNEYIDFRVGAAIREERCNSLLPASPSDSDIVALLNAVAICPEPPNDKTNMDN